MAHNLVDLHILRDPGRGCWHDALFESLSGQSCNIFVVDAIPGNIGRGRLLGYSQGCAPYVSFADDDDIVEPGAIDACIEALHRNPGAAGAYTDEVWIDERGNWLRDGLSVGVEWSLKWHLSTSFGVHHLLVMRRDVLMPLLPIVDGFARSADWTLTRLLALKGRWIHVPMIGYRWRRHAENVSLSPMPQEAVDVVTRAVNSQLRAARLARRAAARDA
jgi:hypothetical protein